MHRGGIMDATGLGSGRSDKDKTGSGKRSVSRQFSSISTNVALNFVFKKNFYLHF